MLVVVSFVRCMMVTVVQVVDMAVVLDRGVAAVWAVFVFVQLRLEVPPARDPVMHRTV